MRFVSIFAIVISAVLVQNVDAGLITVIGAQSSSNNGGSAINTANGVGLDDPVTDAHALGNVNQLVLHGVLTDNDPWVHYDFGINQQLDSMKFWNYNTSDALLTRSIRDLDVYGSTVGAAYGDDAHASWTLLGSFTDMAMQPRATGGLTTDPYGTVYNLTDTNVRYVRFDIVQTWGNQPAFAEVQFFDVVAVPEPSSIVLLAGLFGIALSRRRKRESVGQHI